MRTWIKETLREHKFDLIAVGFLILLPFLVHWNVFFTLGPFPRIYPYRNDFLQTYNMLSLTTHLLYEGGIGLWFPYVGFGIPYLANPLSGILYPPTILLSKFNDPERALLFTSFIIYLFAAKGITSCFFYSLMRDLRINRWGSLVGAVVWGFNLRFDDVIRSPGAAHTLMWLPLLILVGVRLLRNPDRKYIGYFALVFGMMYFANYPTYLLYSMGFLVLFFAFFPFDEKTEFSREQYGRAWIYLCLALALGVGLVAIQLLPGLEFMANWNRRGGFSFSEAMMFRCEPSELVLGYVFPALSYTEKDHYVGLLTLMLAIIGLFARDRRYGFKRLLLFVIVLTAVYSTRSVVGYPLQKVFHACVPLFGGFRCPGRSLILNVFCLAMLSGYGMDALTGLKPIQANLKRIIAITVVILLLGCVIVWVVSEPDQQLLHPAVRTDFIVCALFSALGATLFLMFGDRDRNRALPLLLLALIAGDLFYATCRKNTDPSLHALYYIREDPKIADTQSLITNFVNEKYFSIPPRELERMGRIDRQFHNPLIFTNSILPGPFFDSRYGYEGSIGDVNYFFVKIRDSRRARSLMNTRFGVEYFLPRAYVVYHVERLERAGIMNRLLSPQFDPLNCHYIEQALPEAFAQLSANEEVFDANTDERLGDIARETTLLEYTDTHITIAVDIPRPGYLFLSDVFYPGWKAFVDGIPAAIYRTDFVFRGLPVPEGKHTITFVYRPPRFFIGLILSLAALAGILAILFSGGRYREAGVIALLVLIVYGPLARRNQQRQAGIPGGSVIPYEVEAAEGQVKSMTRLRLPFFSENLHVEADGIYDFLVEFPPQIYQLSVDNEFVARIFNVGTESPPPQEGQWEVQAILRLEKGNHVITIGPVVPRNESDVREMQYMFRRLIPKDAESGEFFIEPIEMVRPLTVRRIKLVEH